MSRVVTILTVAIVLLAGGVLGTSNFQTLAQDATPSYADHPMTGVWLNTNGPDFSPIAFYADGTALFAVAPSYVDPILGTTFQGPGLAAWEPVDDHTIRFTMVQALSDAEGTYIGSFTLEGSPTVSEDGASFSDTEEGNGHIVIRDASGKILVDEIARGNVFAIRLTPGSMEFPMPADAPATPEA